jgi:Rad3-related DNA helicase
MPTILDDLSPVELFMPEKFAEYRDEQKELVDWALYGPEGQESNTRRFTLAGAPGGMGKSLAAHTIGRLSGVKYAVLTATRALEKQNVDDGFDVVNVRGRNNYDCLMRDENDPDKRWDCDNGQEENCEWADTARCLYNRKVALAKAHPHGVLTNYAYWMNARGYNNGALETPENPIQLLICDEFHTCYSALSRHLGTWVGAADLKRWAGDKAVLAIKASAGAEWGRVDEVWVDVLMTAWVEVSKRQEEIARQNQSAAQAGRVNKEYRKLDKLARSLDRVVGLAEDGNWIWRLTKMGVAFDCVWPGRYAERYLWTGIPRVVGLSATLRPKAAGYTGIKHGEYWFREWPRVFPANNAPVYWLPTGRMGRKAEREEKARSIVRLDEICDVWTGYKGIVHTVSYPLAEWFQAGSRYGRHMILSEPGDTARAMEKYKKTPPPCLLVGPTFGTGFDFPEEDVGFQVIPKLPFPDLSDPVVQARREQDRDWLDYETGQAFAQTLCRKSRRKDQVSFTFVTDDAIKGFRHYARQHMPMYVKVRDVKYEKGEDGKPDWRRVEIPGPGLR